jgi:hypothetical protein
MSCSIKKICQDSENSENTQNMDPDLAVTNNCVAFFKDVLDNNIRFKGVINQNKISEEPDLTRVKRKFNTIFFDVIPIDDIPSQVHLNFDFSNFFIITKKGILCIINNSNKNFLRERQYIQINKSDPSLSHEILKIKFKKWN